MTNDKFLLLFILAIFSVGIVSASSLNFNPGDLVNISEVRCLEANDSLCSTERNCTITIINDSHDFLFTNETMLILANSFRGFDAGYSPNYTTTWSSVVDCDNGGVEEFIINIGETATDWETSFIVGLIGLIVLYAFTGFSIFGKEYWLIKFFMYFSAIGILIVLINSAKILSVGSDSDNLMTVGFTIAIISLSIMFLYLFIFFFIEIIKMLKEKRSLKWET